MQEEVENRTVTLAISTTKLTGRVLKAALAKVLNEWKKSRDSPPEIPHGKQSVKDLIAQGQGASSIEVTNQNIKSFDRVARKYGVDYAIKKDRGVTPPKYLVFFKGKDTDALTAAFTEFTAQNVKRAKKPSVLAKLNQFKALVKSAVLDKVKNKDREVFR